MRRSRSPAPPTTVGPPAPPERVQAREPRPAAVVASLRRDDAAWDAFVAASAYGFHTQLSPWATVKAANGWRSVRVVADGGSGPIGAQILVRRVGPGPFWVGYAPRGPIATTWDAASLVAFSAALRRIGAPAAADAHHHGAADRGRGRPAPVRGRRVAGRRTTSSRAEPAKCRSTGRRRCSGATCAPSGGSTWGRPAGPGSSSPRAVATTSRRSTASSSDTATRTGFIPRKLRSYRAVWDAFAPSGAARLLFARLPTGEPVATLFLLRCGGRVVEPYGGMTAGRSRVPRQLPPEMGGDPALGRGGRLRVRHVGPGDTRESSSSRSGSGAARPTTSGPSTWSRSPCCGTFSSGAGAPG